MDLITQISKELQKRGPKIQDLDFGRVVIEIRHSKLFLLRIENDYVPKREEKIIDKAV